jgi:hypothetical protein
MILISTFHFTEQRDDARGRPPPLAVVVIKRRRQVGPGQQRLKRLLTRTSLDGAHGEIHHDWFQGRAAESTVEALMLSLRAGVTALEKPDTLRRLSELSDEQLRAVMVRLQKFTLHIARAWTSEEIAVLLAARGRVHGQQNP